jgi:hypothetical protein
MNVESNEQLNADGNLLELGHLQAFARWLVIGGRSAIAGHRNLADRDDRAQVDTA